MKRVLVLTMFVFFLLVFGFGISHAEITLIDDAEFGTESIILDVDNQREFLRLDFTAPYSYSQVVNEFGQGGLFEGWSVASQVDMEALGTAANIIMGSSDPDMVTRVETLRDWFGEVKTSTTHIYTRGLLSDFIYPSTYNGEKAQLAFGIGVRYVVEPITVDYRVSGYGGEDHWGENIFLTRKAGSAPPVVVDPGNNCDASIDIENSNCDDICIPTFKKEKGKRCFDGIDNDCDGFIDDADSDCIKGAQGSK